MVFVVGFRSITHLNPLAYFVLAWLIVNLASLLQVGADLLIGLGYILMFTLGGDDEVPNEIK